MRKKFNVKGRFIACSLGLVAQMVFASNYAMADDITSDGVVEEYGASKSLDILSLEPVVEEGSKGAMVLDGFIRPYAYSSIASELSGKVIWVSDKVKSGEPFDKGEVIYQIEDIDYQLELAQAKQSLQELKLEYVKEKALYNQAKNEWDNSGLEMKPTDLLLRVPDYELAKTKLETARIALEKAKINLSKTDIKAPFPGLITSGDVNVGDLSQSISDLDFIHSEKFKFKASLGRTWYERSQSLLGSHLSKGEFFLSSDTKDIELDLLNFTPVLNDETHMVDLSLVGNNLSEIGVLINDIASVKVMFNRPGDVYMVPDSSVVPTGFDKGYIYQYMPDRRLERTEVTIINDSKYAGYMLIGFSKEKSIDDELMVAENHISASMIVNNDYLVIPNFIYQSVSESLEMVKDE